MKSRTVVAFIFAMVLVDNTIAQDKCLVLESLPLKASPSHVMCYRDNSSTCCNSRADNQIGEAYKELFTESCNKNFSVRIPILKNFLCRLPKSTET